MKITKEGGIGIGVDPFEPNCDLDISGSGALRIPSGETSQRPSVNEIGQVRFNTTTSQFEGYNNSDAWQGLGGVIDVDQDTYISAESAPTADEDQLTFYTSGSQKMKITKEGNFSLTNPFVETGWNQFGQDITGPQEPDSNGVMMGICVSMDNSGTTIAASLHSGDVETGDESGLYQIYRYDPASELWYQLGDTLSLGPEVGTFNKEGDGVQLAGNGNIVVIQSRSYDASTTTSNYDNGGVAVYEYSDINKNWFQRGHTVIGGHAEYWGGFGAGISINDDGTILAIGSFAADSADGKEHAGKVTLYEYNDTEDYWYRFGSADAGVPDEVSQRNIFYGVNEIDYFGQSVCLNSSGHRMAISSTNASSGVLLYVYEYSYTDAPLFDSTDLINRYLFENNYNDSSGGGNDLIEQHIAHTFVQNTDFPLIPITYYVTSPRASVDFTQNVPLSFAFWWNPNATGGSYTPFSVGTADDGDIYGINVDYYPSGSGTAGDYYAYFTFEGGAVYIPFIGKVPNYPDAVFSHWVITIDSSSLCNLYFNGSIVGTVQGSGNLINMEKLNIGRNTNNSRFNIGYIGDFRVYSRVITRTEIVNAYNQVAWTKLGTTIISKNLQENDNTFTDSAINSDGSIVALTGTYFSFNHHSLGGVEVWQYDDASNNWNQLGQTLFGEIQPGPGVLNNAQRFGGVTRNGISLSSDGYTLAVVSQMHSSDEETIRIGATYIFKYVNDDWNLVQKINDTAKLANTHNVFNSNFTSTENNSCKLNADGTKIVIGGHHADLNQENSGIVRTYQLSQTSISNPVMDISGGAITFNSQMKVDVNNYIRTPICTMHGGTNIAGLGASMSMSSDGKIWAISTDEHTTHINNTVEVYERRGDTYYPLGQVLKADYETEGSYGFGAGAGGVTLSGDGKVLIVGALAYNNMYTTDGTRVYGFVNTYRYINEQWTLFGETPGYTTGIGGTTLRVSIVPPNNHTEANYWGTYSATNNTGDLVAISQFNASNNGGIYRYDSNNDTWIFEYTFPFNSFGVGMTLDGNRVVSCRESVGVAGQGVNIYDYVDGSWVFTRNLNFQYQSDDRIGRQVAISGDGNTISTSNSNENSNGNSYIQVYRYSPDASYNWTRLGTDILGKKADGSIVTSRFGDIHKLSYDGNTIAIGGGGGVYNIAYLFKYINGNWEKIGYDFDGDANSIALSQDGNTFAFGQRGDYAGTGIGNGTVRAYQISYEPTMNIDNNVTTFVGHVCIGTKTPNGYLLNVAGDVNAESYNAQTYYADSDIRLKENILSLENSLQKVNQLRGVDFTWKKDKTKKINTGLIAQELEEVLPELVTTNSVENEEGYHQKSVNYVALVPHLIESIKTLTKEKEEIHEELEMMKEKMQKYDEWFASLLKH